MPKLVPPAVMTGLFASASWLDVWAQIPHQARPVVLAAWAVATAASPLLMKGKKWIVRERDAVKFMDDQAGAGYPASTLTSKPPANLTPESRALWDAQQAKTLLEYVPGLRAHRPDPQVGRLWLNSICGVALATLVTAGVAGDQRMPRLYEAFNFTAPAVPEAPLDISAYVTPPKGFPGLKPQYITDAPGDLAAHKNSVLHISVIGKQPVITLNGAPVTLEKELSSDESAKVTYQYKPILLGAGRQEVKIAGGPSWVIDVAPDNAPDIRLNGAGTSAENPESLAITACDMRDDHGIAGGRIVFEMPWVEFPAGDPAAPAKPELPPSAALPQITLPGGAFCDPAPK